MNWLCLTASVTTRMSSTTTPSGATAGRSTASLDLAWFIPVVVIATILVAIAFFVSLAFTYLYEKWKLSKLAIGWGSGLDCERNMCGFPLHADRNRLSGIELIIDENPRLNVSR